MKTTNQHVQALINAASDGIRRRMQDSQRRLFSDILPEEFPDNLGAALPDTGARTSFPTGAVRDAMQGKGDPHAIPPCFIRAVARRFEDGRQKYGGGNWLKGIPLSRYQDAIIRHTLAWAEGQTDEDHAGAVGWNVAAWMETERRIRAGQLPAELDDLPYREVRTSYDGPSQVAGPDLRSAPVGVLDTQCTAEALECIGPACGEAAAGVLMEARTSAADPSSAPTPSNPARRQRARNRAATALGTSAWPWWGDWIGCRLPPSVVSVDCRGIATLKDGTTSDWAELVLALLEPGPGRAATVEDSPHSPLSPPPSGDTTNSPNVQR